jgi:parallel beta-helix repeat protein
MKLKLSIPKSFLLAFLVAAPITVNAVSCGDFLPAGTTTLVDGDDLSNCDCSSTGGFALIITGTAKTLDLGGQTVGCNRQFGSSIVVRGNGNTVRDGYISGGGIGITLDGGGHTVTGVTVSGAAVRGFSIGSVESTFTSNTLTGNRNGILVEFSDNARGNTFTCNTVSDNDRDGFFVDSTGNTFTSNTASNNGGVDFEDFTRAGEDFTRAENDGCTANTYDGNAGGTSTVACILEDIGFGTSDPVCREEIGTVDTVAALLELSSSLRGDSLALKGLIPPEEVLVPVLNPFTIQADNALNFVNENFAGLFTRFFPGN